MALINTLRKRMGKIVVGVVALSMFAFILTDLFQSNSALFGGRDNEIAEIAGNTITYEDFQRKVDELSYVFAVNNQRNPTSEELDRIREQAWLAFVLENAYREQFEELGLEVTDAEVVDMVQGNNIDPQIKQFFTDPNTGEFNRQNVITFLQQLENAPQQQRVSWITFEERLAPARLVKKYENIFEKTIYVTQAEAKETYQAQNSNMTVDYFYVPFFSVADSLISVSREEMEDYLSAHADEYQRDESRSLSYVTFPVRPSAADSAFVKEEIESLRKGLKNAQNDSVYASINSDGPNPFQSIQDPSLLPEALKVDGEVPETGTVSEPILAGNTYTVLKLSDITEGDEYFVKASHILIETEGTSESAKEEARQEANRLIAQLRRGADFAELAAEHSADQSNAQRGGDLGWFGENGNFVQAFKDAAFSHRGTGLIPEPVETSFGFHIIKIDEPKTNTVYKVARVEKEFFASDETLNETYRQADLLAANSSGVESFRENAEQQGYTVRNAANIGKNESRIGVIPDARTIVLWLYNQASVGDISEVFELENSYVVAVMTGKQPEGTASLSQVENEIRTKVLQQKKTDFVIDKLAGLQSDDFEAMKESYGEEARVGQADLTLSSNSFPNVGFAPEAVGVAFSLNEGEKTDPFQITNGVIILKAVAKSMAEEQEDYSTYISQIESRRRSRKTVIANFPLTFYPLFVSQRLNEAVKEAAEIEDNRYKFF